MIALAGPVLLGLDLIVRRLVIGSQAEDLQEFLAEVVTRVAWLATPGPVVGGLLGFFVYRRLHAKAMASGTDVDPVVREQRADTRALLLSCTMAQLPALLGDLSVMLGARLTPALVMTGTSVALVLVIAAFARPAVRP